MSINSSSSRAWYISLTRLVLLLTLAIILMILLLSASPIDPISAYFDGNALAVSADRKIQLTEQLGLNQTAFERAQHFINSLWTGDLGYSHHYQEPVSDIIWRSCRYSIILMTIASIVSLIIGYTIGLLLGLFSDNKWSKTLTYIALIINTVPSFWFGLILISVFAIELVWLPIGGISPLGIEPSELTLSERIPYFILPLVTLCFSLMSPIILHTKEKVVEVCNSNHVQYARLHGKSTVNIIQHHLLRNTLIPALVIQLAGLSELLSGSVIIETVFNFPGIGQTLVKAGLSGDTPLLLGITFCCAILVFFGNALASLLSKQILLSNSL